MSTLPPHHGRIKGGPLATTPVPADQDLLANATAALLPPGQVVELRAPHADVGRNFTATVSGYYDDPKKLVADAAGITAPGVYFTLNPVDPRLLARRSNRVQHLRGKDPTTADKDIIARRWLFAEVDPARPSGICASDDEKAAARAVADAVQSHLKAEGWPDPIRIDSGNGEYLLYRIDQPVDDGGLVERCLKALAHRFDTPVAHIDTSVFNPSRIIRLPGTMNRKGDHTPDRPHRPCRVLTVPDDMRVTSVELLRALAATAPDDKQKKATTSNSAGDGDYAHRLMVEKYLGHHGIKVLSEKTDDDPTRWRISCPFSEGHTGTDAYVFQYKGGAVGFKCSHNSCAGNKWEAFKDKIGKPLPDHYDPPMVQAGLDSGDPTSVADGADDQNRPSGKKAGKKKSKGGEGGGEKGPSAAELLFAIAASKSELWHDDTGVGFATIGRLSAPVRSKKFRDWLINEYRKAFANKVPNNDALGNAVAAIDAAAIYDHPEHRAFVRVGWDGGRVYVNLGDADATVYEIGPDGWGECRDVPVRFRFSPTARPLPRPVRGGSIGQLLDLLRMTDADTRALVEGWLLSAYMPDAPRPILLLNGEQGALKTTTTVALRAVCDPSALPTRSTPKDEQDLQIAARGNWVLAFDNLSCMPDWLSDGLCKLATGIGLGTRTLYTPDEETVFQARRPTVIASIDDLATRPDLVDRGVNVVLPAIPKSERMPDTVFWRRFDAIHPAVLGAVFDRVSAGLRAIEAVRATPKDWPRMADFCQWAMACEKGSGNKAVFYDAYERNQQSAAELPLEDSPLTQPLLKLMASHKDGFDGTSSDLLAALTLIATDPKSRDWPKKPNALSNRLRRLAPNFRDVHGLLIATGRDTSSNTVKRFVRITWEKKAGKESPESDQQPPPEERAKSSSAPSAGPNQRTYSGPGNDFRADDAAAPSSSATVSGSSAHLQHSLVHGADDADDADDWGAKPSSASKPINGKGLGQKNEPADGADDDFVPSPGRTQKSVQRYESNQPAGTPPYTTHSTAGASPPEYLKSLGNNWDCGQVSGDATWWEVRLRDAGWPWKTAADWFDEQDQFFDPSAKANGLTAPQQTLLAAKLAEVIAARAGR